MIRLILLIVALNALAAPVFAVDVKPAAAPECVNVFFDRGPAGYWMGRTYSLMLQNLLGHFPQFQQIVSPIELYEKGDIEKCRATFYLGSYYDTQIPAAFLEDYARAKKPVAWFGYGIWKAPAEELFGYRFKGFTKLDSAVRDAAGYPSYYKYIDYKGETFYKFGDWSKTDPKTFLAPFEQVELEEVSPDLSQVLATARHSRSNRAIPYALRAKNRFYVADIPFSFLHEADRYLITADLLFDILGVQAKHEKRAFLRIEDVHALSPLADLFEVDALLKREGVPSNISIIPTFFDPLKTYNRPLNEEYITMDRKPEFLSALHELKANGSSFIWHGVTHQYGVIPNPHNGATGDDFEFWDAVKNKGVAEDGARWVLDRLDDGLYTILKSGLPAPTVWLTPHYQASALDYMIFARVFPWNVGRVIYFNFYAKGLGAAPNLALTSIDPAARAQRLEYFSKVDVTLDPSAPWNGQFFPFEIYGDVYGQRLIPENLGNSQPYISEHVVRTRSPKEIVADAKRNLVIRDAWASLFYHPYLLQTFKNGGRGTYPGDSQELGFILREIKKLGYKFLSADEFSKNQPRLLRPEPIYRDQQP
ncbi:MAG: DUF2334 domain-containing protein [Proteobacteria bacterium]|nr:MAG: DUF2334 domain-containing protein [Pseudomonadota bacterium]